MISGSRGGLYALAGSFGQACRRCSVCQNTIALRQQRFRAEMVTVSMAIPSWDAIGGLSMSKCLGCSSIASSGTSTTVGDGARQA